VLATALVGAIALATVALRTYLRPVAEGVADENLIAVVPFQVMDTSLALWRQGLPDLLARALDGAGPLRAMRVLQDSPGATDLTPVTGLGAGINAGLVLSGGVARTGADSVVLTGVVHDRASGAVVADVGVRGSEAMIDALTDSLAVDLLRAMGRGRAIAATQRVSLVARSLPALREFLRGEQFYRRDEVDSAMAHYYQATVEDPGLAMAHRRLGWLILSNQETGAGYGSPQEEVTRAVALNHGLNPRDSLLLLIDSLKLAVYSASSPDGLLRDIFSWTTLMEEAGRRFPYDAEIWSEVGETRVHQQPPLSGTLDNALAAFERAVQLDPGYANGYWHAVELALRLRQPAVAARYARAASHLDPADEPGGMTLTSLVLDSGLAAPATRRTIASAAPRTLLLTGIDHLAWAADSDEAAVVILREFASRNDPVVRATTIDPKLRYRFLAEALAFRGHLHAAAATGLARATDPAAFGVDMWNDPFTELALLGAVPDSFARMEYAQAFEDGIPWASRESGNANPRALRGVPWWYARRDTASLRRFEARARAVAAGPGSPVARLRGRYYAGIVPAYLALARGDSAGARRRLEAVSDSLCVVASCTPEKRLLAQLLSAAGDDRQAAQVLDLWGRAVGDLVPSAVLIELERGGIAERLGDRARARRAYGFVVDVWRNADPELQGYVRAARDGLVRLAGT
jgi:serine/threonine-protein kinase